MNNLNPLQMRHLLSKSTYVYGCQCPKRLYLHKFKPELKDEEDEEQTAIYSSGTSVGMVARDLFPGGINAEPKDPFSYPESVAKTKTLIETGTKVIYEAAFMHNQVLCAVDILVNDNGKWYAYEVKGTSKVKPAHITDAALQFYVITNAGIALADMFLVHLNTQYVKNGSLDVQQLFTKSSILTEVLTQQQAVENKIQELMQLLKDKVEPQISVGPQCIDPYPCNFSGYCNQGIQPVPVVSDRPDHTDVPYLRSFVESLKYPLYFLDFETIMPAIPEFDGSRPFQQVPFQYSIHIQQTPTSELIHLEFLGDGQTDPRAALAESMIANLGTKGSIVVWYQTFEKTRINELAFFLPQYQQQLLALNERVVDLMVPFKQKAFYKQAFNESASIKAVLPGLLPQFSYQNLVIQNGLDASRIYSELKYQPTEAVNQIRKDLLKYCKLDTMAMVKILEKVKELV